MYLHAFEETYIYIYIYTDFTNSDYFFFSGIFVSNDGYGDDCPFFLIIKTEEILNEKKEKKNGEEGF